MIRSSKTIPISVKYQLNTVTRYLHDIVYQYWYEEATQVQKNHWTGSHLIFQYYNERKWYLYLFLNYILAINTEHKSRWWPRQRQFNILYLGHLSKDTKIEWAGLLEHFLQDFFTDRFGMHHSRTLNQLSIITKPRVQSVVVVNTDNCWLNTCMAWFKAVFTYMQYVLSVRSRFMYYLS